MPRKHPPLLHRGGLSGRVYIITRYTETANGKLKAEEKYDVTEEFEALVAEREAPREAPEGAER